MDEYQYKRLNHDRPTFRLLRLHQASRDELTCSLFEALLHHDDLIQYEALSYTWGAPATPRSVTVDEQKLAITENLYQALINLRRPFTDRILWIDAICIDQSNKRERSHQVAQMSDIYKQAGSVIFFLGRATFSTDAFMDYMSHFQQERSKYAYRSWARDDKRWKIIQEASQGEMDKLDIDMLSLGLKSILSRSWFLRVWILQEVANAKSAIVHCGRKEIVASVFSIAPVIFDVSPSVHCQSVIDIMPGPWRQTSWWSKGPCLYTLLSKFGGSQATESRDLIYALRGIATDKESPILIPDYDKSEECLVRDVVRFLFDFEYNAKMAWSMLGTIKDVIRGLERVNDLIFMERIRNGEVSRLDSLLQAPGFTFPPTAVGAAIQYDKTGQILETLMKHAKGYDISTKTLLTAVEKGSVSVVRVLEHHLNNEFAAATKDMLLAAVNNQHHGGKMISYILARNQDLDDYGPVAEVAASNSTQAAAWIIQQLLDRGTQITMTPQFHENAFKSGCYKKIVFLFIDHIPCGLQMRNEIADMDANKPADKPADDPADDPAYKSLKKASKKTSKRISKRISNKSADDARMVFRTITRFLLSDAVYEDTLFGIFKHSCRQIEGHGYNILEELTLCAVEVFKEGGRALSMRHDEVRKGFVPLTWVAEMSRVDLCITIGVVKASIEGSFTGIISRFLTLKGDSVTIESDAAAEIIRAYCLGERDDMLMTEFVLLYRGGQFQETEVVSEAFKERYCDPKSWPLKRWFRTTLEYDSFETCQKLLSCGVDPDEKDNHGDTLLMSAKDYRAVALLLSYGADPNIRPRLGRHCALCRAVEERNYEILELLLLFGANPNTVDCCYDNTPLIRAVRANGIRLVRMLLRYGADTAPRTRKGESVKDLTNSRSIICLLQKRSSRSLVRKLRISPVVQRIMKNYGRGPKSCQELRETRLLWHTQEIGYKAHGSCKKRKFKDIGE